MENGYIQVENGQFKLNNKKIILRGFSVGSWMNIENFMLRDTRYRKENSTES